MEKLKLSMKLLFWCFFKYFFYIFLIYIIDVPNLSFLANLGETSRRIWHSYPRSLSSRVLETCATQHKNQSQWKFNIIMMTKPKKYKISQGCSLQCPLQKGGFILFDKSHIWKKMWRQKHVSIKYHFLYICYFDK